MEITYFVHGSTADNKSKTATGWAQISLSKKGIEETQLAAQFVNAMDYDMIYVSDLARAVESANILFAIRKAEIIIDEQLRECDYGYLTGKSNSQLNYKEHIYTPFPNGESLYDVEGRMRLFLKKIHLFDYKRIAIVSHRAPQLALDVITLKRTWEDAIDEDWRICGNWQPGWKYQYM